MPFEGESTKVRAFMKENNARIARASEKMNSRENTKGDETVP